MVKKEFQLCGKTLNELMKITIEEFAELLPSKQRRTLKRGFSEAEKKLLYQIRTHKSDKPIKTHVRDMTIIPEMVSKRLAIHNGKEWVIVEILPEMLGHRLGEFSLTRKRVNHSGPGIGATRGSKFVSVK